MFSNLLAMKLEYAYFCVHQEPTLKRNIWSEGEKEIAMPCGCRERVKPTRARKSYEGMKRTDCFTVPELLLHTHSIYMPSLQMFRFSVGS